MPKKRRRSATETNRQQAALLNAARQALAGLKLYDLDLSEVLLYEVVRQAVAAGRGGDR